MLNYFLSLWSKNKILFFIFIVPVILSVAIKIFLAFNVAGGEKDIKKAEDKDKELKNQADEAKVKAGEARTKADCIENSIKDNTVRDNWYEDADND